MRGLVDGCKDVRILVVVGITVRATKSRFASQYIPSHTHSMLQANCTGRKPRRVVASIVEPAERDNAPLTCCAVRCDVGALLRVEPSPTRYITAQIQPDKCEFQFISWISQLRPFNLHTPASASTQPHLSLDTHR